MSARQGFAALTAAQRQLAAAHGSLTNWSRITSPDARRQALAPARAGMTRRLEAIAQQDGPLPPDELAVAVDALRRAHYKRMALASSRARARR